MAKSNNINWTDQPCRGCEDNCLGYEGFSGCVEYTGADVPELGVKCGMNMNEVLSILFSAIGVSTTQPAPSVKKTTADEVVMPTYVGETVYNDCAYQISNLSYSYSLNPGASMNTLSWNVTPVSSNIPTGFSVIDFKISITGGASGVTGPIYSGSSKSGTTNLSLNQFPASATLRMQINSPCGVLILTSNISLPSASNSGTYTGIFTINGAPSNGDTQLTLTQKLQNLEREIANLKAK